MTEERPTPAWLGLVRPVAIGVVTVALYAFFFLYPAHDPEPNGLPIGAVGIDLQADDFEVRAYETPEEAREAVLDREVYGALGANNAYVASAASFQVAQIVRDLAGARNVEDVRPLDPDDPRGTSVNALVLPLAVTGILGALVLFQLAAGAPWTARLAALAAFAVLGALVAVLIATAGLGVLPGPFLGAWAVAALAMFALASTSAALMARLGGPGVGAAFLLFLMLGAPASGAAAAPELLPDPWSWGGQLLPPGALATGLRNVAYFDGAQVASWLPVLAAWSALGVLALSRDPRRPAAA